MNPKHKKLEDNNYWPGYVDALINVVLSMLFTVGIMAAGLISLNIEALDNFKLMRQARQLYQVNEENMLLAALGTFMAAIPDVPKPTPTESRAVPPKPESPPPPAPPPVLVKPEPPRAVPSTLRVGRLQAAPVLEVEMQQLSERMQWGDQASVSVLEFEPFVFQVSATQISQIRQLVTQTNADRWSLAVTVDGDERTVREAYWRMTRVRQQLLAAGVSQDVIAMRTVNMLAPNTGASRRVFMAHLRNS